MKIDLYRLVIILIVFLQTAIQSQTYSLSGTFNTNISNSVYWGYYGFSVYGSYEFENNNLEFGPIVKVFTTGVDVDILSTYTNSGIGIGAKLIYAPLEIFKTEKFSFFPYFGISGGYQFNHISPNGMMFSDTIKYNELNSDFSVDFTLGLRVIPAPKYLQFYTEFIYQLRNPLLNYIKYDINGNETQGQVYKSFNTFFWSFGIRILL